ncbi:MAG: VWA domain-containing protein [Candidatus Woesearchaeota archaeon]
MTLAEQAGIYWGNVQNLFMNLLDMVSSVYVIRNLKHPWVIILFILLGIALWMIIRRNFISFRSDEEKRSYISERRWIRRYTALSRFLIVLLLGIALASPFILEEETVQGDLSITVLADNSTSFSLFDRSLAAGLKEKLDMAFPARLKYIAEGHRSDLSGGLLNSMKGDDNILLVTDGRNNYGKSLSDMMMLAANLNSTINMVDVRPVKDDTSVVIRGVDKAIRGTRTTFSIPVRQVGEDHEYRIVVKVGREVVVDEKGVGSRTFSFTKKMGEGSHKLTAELEIDEENDHFTGNNRFNKVVEILPMPKIYMMSGKKSRFYSLMTDLYNFKRQKEFPDDIESYAALIMDDISADRISRDDYEDLSNFVMNGSGLVVIGGEDSYNNGGYRNSLFETILPVKTMDSEKEGTKDEKVNIVLLIDVSGSTGGKFSVGSGDTKVDVEKSLAVGVLDYIKGESKVGVIAFNAEAYEVSPLEPLNQKAGLHERIQRLVEGGDTDIGKGIEAASMMLNKAKGSSNIILISDGVTSSPSGALAMTERARRLGISIFTVGVGSDTYEPMLKEIAHNTGGLYYRPAQSEKLKLVFGEPEDDDECTEENKRVKMIDENHFITRGLTVDAVLHGHNYVAPKSNANSLLVTCDAHPVMTAWRYGLGRVAAMSTDDGTKWAGDFLSKRNSELITRMINWAIGDPKRKDDFYVDVHDTTLGKPIEVKVKSKERPESDLVDFSMIDDNMYKGSFSPDETGFYDMLGAEVAVSYNDELQKIGLNPELYDLVRATGGEVFAPDDIEGMINKTKSVSRRVETSEEYIRWPFIAAAIALLLIEIIIRRLWETKR